MFALAVKEDVKFVMGNHVFRYRDKYYCQSEGGSIGSELTHQLAACRMIVFVRKLRSSCLALGLRVFLLKVFVDDTMVLMKFPGRGAVVRDGQLEIDVSLADKEVADAEDVLSAR